ncbi:MAG: DNA mismatch repair endonuclease MutH [Ectothiorhodospiraceae bacterium AqS1]|nr:DNA mismatch repair endonuclease MutH [Ectothiorhodospiraceae bacterium AqS1]
MILSIVPRPSPPPRSEEELMARANALAGRTLGEVAHEYALTPLGGGRYNKGWIGMLIEHVLGASAASRPEPDFPLLSVELKTIPVGRFGRPLESTFVCTVPVAGDIAADWRQSNIFRKLARVLWMPFEGERAIPLGARRIGSPLLWSPSPEEDALLERDWGMLMDRVIGGQVQAISPSEGEYLQIRPKAANAAARRSAFGADGEREMILPRGFYLRPSFTAALLSSYYS